MSIYVLIYTHIYVKIYTYVHMHACVYVCVFHGVYVGVCVCLYMYTTGPYYNLTRQHQINTTYGQVWSLKLIRILSPANCYPEHCDCRIS